MPPGYDHTGREVDAPDGFVASGGESITELAPTQQTGLSPALSPRPAESSMSPHASGMPVSLGMAAQPDPAGSETHFQGDSGGLGVVSGGSTV